MAGFWLTTLAVWMQADVAAEAVAVQETSVLAWAFTALGIFYGLVLPLSGLMVFIGACLVVVMSRRPVEA